MNLRSLCNCCAPLFAINVLACSAANDPSEETGRVSSKVNSWTSMGGCAKDVAGLADHLWILGCAHDSPGSSNWEIYGRVDGVWRKAPGSGVAVAVGPDNKPWMIKASGNIYRFSTTNPTTGSWNLVPGGGCARDITADLSNVYVLGCPGSPDHGVYRWTGSGWSQVGTGTGHKIGMYRGGPMIAASDTTIWVWQTVLNTWEQMDGLAYDVGNDWVIGTDNEAYWAGPWGWENGGIDGKAINAGCVVRLDESVACPTWVP